MYLSFICFIGLEVKLKNLFYPVIIAPMHVNELKCIENTTGGIKFGASVTLTRLEEELRSVIEKYPGKRQVKFEVSSILIRVGIKDVTKILLTFL